MADESEKGLINPAMDDIDMDEVQALSGGSSSEIVEELKDARNLKHTLTKKRRQKQKELSEKLISPKDDLATELRTAKKRSKKRLDETAEMAEEAVEESVQQASVSGLGRLADDDGTVPMSEDEEAEPKAAPETLSLSGSATSERLQKFRKRMSQRSGTPEEAVEEGEEATPKTEEKPTSRLSKMRSRLQKAKELGESEAKEEDRKVQRERRAKGRSNLTRFDTEGYDLVETERNNEEKARKLRLRWKKMEEAVTDKGGVYIPTAEESYDFFTRVYEPEEEETPPKDEKAKKESPAEGEAPPTEGATPTGEEEEGDEPTPGTSQEAEQEEETAHDDRPEDERPLLDDFEDEFGLVAVRKAEYKSIADRKKEEENLLYVPSVISIPPSEKVSEQMEPRFLEEEGFYVGERPAVKLTNMNRLEHRLLKEGSTGRRWFGEDGRVISLPDPLKASPSRPPVPDEAEPYLETVFHKAVMKEFDSRYIDGAVDGSGQYQLDIDINSISFTHHHLFSREHVLAAKLTHLFDQYLVRKKQNMVNFLTEKLKALKTSATHLQEHLLAHKREMGKVDRDNYNKRLGDYSHEITKTRLARDSEEQADRTLLKNIIAVWKEIKKLRTDQNFTNTAVKLQIRKETVDKTEDEAKWKAEVEEELQEVKEAKEKEFADKMAAYNTLLDAFNIQQKEKKAATKRQKKLERRGSRSQGSQGSQVSVRGEEGEQTEEEIQKDNELLAEPDLPEPPLPVKEEEKDLREHITTKAMQIRRRPGEPKLFPELTNTATITPTASCPRGEQQRRDQVSKCKLFIKILFNNKEVSRTSSKPLSQDFRVNYGQIYNLKIVKWPESLKLKIYESVGLSTSLMAEIYAGIPEASVTSDIVQLEDLEFSSDLRVSHENEGVGSGVAFSFDAQHLDLVCLMTSGVVVSSVGWGVEPNGTPLVPPSSNTANNIYNAMKRLDPVAAIGAAGMMDMDKLSKWVTESRLDPNDPSNADLMYLFRPRGDNLSVLKPPEYFRLEQLQEEFNFVNDEDIENNKRFRLIQYRDAEINEFRTVKMIPANERDVARDTFTEYEKKKREEEKIRRMEDIESHRAAVARYMQRIREQVIRRFRLAAHQKRLEEMVLEEAVPNIAMIGISLMKFSEPRHPLRPERRERKKVTAQGIKGDEVKILVNITRAFDIPIRTPQTRATSRGAGERAAPGQAEDAQVRPFVEALFQRNTKRTTVVDGPNPSFNEELELPFKAPNDDFSTGSLQSINDNIYINLFDEVTVDILEDDRQRENTVHQRLEKKWLGSLRIPFSTIYLNGKIDGTFRVNAPPVLLGYSRKGQSSNEMDVDIGMGEKSQTYLSMFITIEPPLLPGEPARERFSSNEDEKLLMYSETWQAECEQAFPKRDVKTTVIDVSGKTVFLTRFIKAIKPPEEVVSAGSTPHASAEMVARFVSLIPFLSDSVVFPGLCDIWSTCDQFMQMLAGDEEEHAVLLTNYFLSMGKTAWLVLGHGIPEGPTAYVLTLEERDFRIWNASTGENFSSRDAFCPLQSIGCVINSENIWANIQQYEQPARITFDFQNTKTWKPFFSRSYPSPCLSSVQPESLMYVTPEKEYVLDLQEKIEQTLKNKIMEWRRNYITRWNRYCTQSIRNLLPKLEESMGKSVADQHLSELENFLSNYRMSGFPMNQPFTEIGSIVESVYATGVHTQESSDVEYALAVHIHPYPNSVLSVWVYVASLLRIR